MNKHLLKKLTNEAMTETQKALQTIYDSLNQGQQKKLLKNEEVVSLFERYNVIT